MSQKKISHATFNIRNIEKINENFEELYGREGGGGIGDVGEITTDQVFTNPDVLFRDSKGRFKSSETVPELKNQLEVNRWFFEQIEGIEAGDLDLPEMTSEATKNTLVLRDGSGNARFNAITTKGITFNQAQVSNNTADTWFLSGGETSTHGVKKNDAAGMRSSLDVYSKSEVDALGVGGGDITLNKVTALKGNFGGAQDLRSFNVYGTGHNGRLSIQGGDNDNPGVEMTTDNNATRVLQRIARAGTNGTELQVFTQRDGSNIHLPFVFGEGGEFFLKPKGSTADTANDAGFRNQSGTLEFKNDNGVWTAFDTAGKDGVDGKDGDSFFQDIGNNTVEYFGDQLWVTSLKDPIFIGAKIGADSTFSGAVTANKFVGDGSALTGTVSAEVLVDAFESLQLAVAAETTVAGLKSALVVTLGSLIEQLGQKDSEE